MTRRYPIQDYIGPKNLEANSMCGMCEGRKRRGEPSCYFWWCKLSALRIWVDLVGFGRDVDQTETEVEDEHEHEVDQDGESGEDE